jgi:arylamine N-acetyltransferase
MNMNNFLTADQVKKYLRILGVKNTAPSIEALDHVVGAHITKIPFENISKLYYLNKMNLRSIPGADQYLDGIEKYNFGGTCYSNNFYLHLLLKSLGYNIRLCGADMNQPDVHMVNIIEVDGREYLVDGGNAAPFFNPLPRDISEDYSIATGNSLYVLKPRDAGGRSRMNLYRDGQHIHGYLAKPEPKTLDDFQTAILDSFSPESTFMRAVLLTRFFDNSSVIIHNYTLIKTLGKSISKNKLNNHQELIKAIEIHFRIPSAITEQALSGRKKFKNVWE